MMCICRLAELMNNRNAIKPLPKKTMIIIKNESHLEECSNKSNKTVKVIMQKEGDFCNLYVPVI